MTASAVVWVMMVMSYNGHFIPSLEFKSEEKCVKAAAAIKAAVSDKLTMGNMYSPFCVRIEK